RPGRATILIARLFGSLRSFGGVSEIGRKFSGTRAVARKRSTVWQEPSILAGVDGRKLSALGSTSCRLGRGELTVGERAAEASFGIGESSDKRIRMGAQAERR